MSLEPQTDHSIPTDDQPTDDPHVEERVDEAVDDVPPGDDDPSEATPEGEQPETQAEQTLRERLGLQGYYEGVESDEELMRRLADDARRRHEIETQWGHFQSQYGSQFREYVERQNEFQQFLQQQQSAQPADQEPWHKKVWQGLPEFDPSELDAWVEVDPETGRQKFRADTPVEIKQRAYKYNQARQELSDRILSDFPSLVLEIVKASPLMDEFRQQAAHELTGREVQSEIQQWEQANADWLYQKDASGGFARDWSGNPIPSQHGQRFLQIANEVRQMGVSDPLAIRRVAEERLRGELALGYFQAQQQQQQATPEQVNQQQKQQFLQQANAAARKPNRGGSVPSNPSQGTQNPSLSLTEKALQKAREMGLEGV